MKIKGFNYMKKMGRIKFAFLIESIYITILLINCFKPCTEFIFDKYNLDKSLEGELVYFDDGSVGIDS